MKSFAVRTGSTVVLVGSFAAIVSLGHVPLALMILGIQALMVRELLALAARARATSVLASGPLVSGRPSPSVPMAPRATARG